MPDPAGLNLLAFLRWVGDRPRSYAETMEAWRSSCPRLSAWEDALGAGLVRVENTGAGPAARCKVVLTERGRSAIAPPTGS